MPTQTSTYKLLIVDDDKAQRALQKEILQQHNHIVFEAENAEQTLSFLKNNDVDAVLLDKYMPRMDGDTLCFKIRNELGLELLPIIIVTGTNDRNELVKSLNAGANDFIFKPFNPAELVARVSAAAKLKRVTDQLDDMESMLFSLARMIEAKDEHTGNHCERLARISRLFGEKLGLKEDQLKALEKGGVLHDIGKLGIPDSILMKPGKLDDTEREIMNTHPLIGYQLCGNLKSMKTTAPIILSHHERWDGSGYPQGLKGNDIPYIAQIFQLVDIFDALTYERPYKPALSVEKAIEIIEAETEKGWRNPELVKKFVDFVRNKISLQQIHDKLDTNFHDDIIKGIYHG